MLRKLTLVGLVVLAGRGSVAQNMCSSILSFFFFALHLKVWPMKMEEDNILRASCEFHVFLTITTAFVMRSDLSHESKIMGQDPSEFYGDALLLTFVVCVPGAFLATMYMYAKYRRTRTIAGSDLSLPEHSISQIPGPEFVRFSIGLALSDDRAHLREYFEKRSARMTQAQVFEDYATEVLDHRGRVTHLLETSQLGALLARLCRPTVIERLNRVDNIDMKSSSATVGSCPVKLLRASATVGETREVVQVWKWLGSADGKGEWNVHREIEETDDSLAGRLDLADARLDGMHVELRSDAGRRGVVVQRSWLSSKVRADFCRSGGTKNSGSTAGSLLLWSSMNLRLMTLPR